MQFKGWIFPGWCSPCNVQFVGWDILTSMSVQLSVCLSVCPSVSPSASPSASRSFQLQLPLALREKKKKLEYIFNDGTQQCKNLRPLYSQRYVSFSLLYFLGWLSFLALPLPLSSLPPWYPFQRVTSFAYATLCHWMFRPFSFHHIRRRPYFNRLQKSLTKRLALHKTLAYGALRDQACSVWFLCLGALLAIMMDAYAMGAKAIIPTQHLWEAHACCRNVYTRLWWISPSFFLFLNVGRVSDVTQTGINGMGRWYDVLALIVSMCCSSEESMARMVLLLRLIARRESGLVLNHNDQGFLPGVWLWQAGCVDKDS